MAIPEDPRLPKLIIMVAYFWSLTFVPLVFFLNLNGDPIVRATLGMVLGLNLIWTVFLGLLMWKYRVALRNKFHESLSSHLTITFIVLSTLMSMIEEAVTVGMTNTASPIWGVSPNEAHITASTNYWVVISQHSVIVFIPLFITWGLALKKYNFHPVWVYVLFGLTGSVAEIFTFGQTPIIVLQWINVYGLMVFLPSYLTYTEDRQKAPELMYILMIFIPLLFTVISIIVVHILLTI